MPSHPGIFEINKMCIMVKTNVYIPRQHSPYFNNSFFRNFLDSFKGNFVFFLH